MSKPHVMIVEDDHEIRSSLVDLLDAAGWTASAFPRAEDALKQLDDLQPAVVLSDIQMPGMGGLALLDTIPGDGPPIVLISAHGDIPMAVDAMSRGAYSFVEKPFEPRRLLTILSHAADQYQMKAANERLKDRLVSVAGLNRILLGQSAAMQGLRDTIMDFSDTGLPVLIKGETGTGKELVARALHNLGPRAEQNFLALNASLLTAETLAKSVHPADGGTLFLDEVGACPVDVQAMFLRLIEHKELPAEDGSILSLDIRILSATNENVDEAVAAGTLRSDLLFRLNPFTISIPPLRERKDDILLLATHFLDTAAQTYEIATPEITAQDVKALLAHDWPGNVRELRSVADRRTHAARRGLGSLAEAISPLVDQDDVPDTLREAVASFERELIGKAIQSHQGRMDAVAEALGIGRRTLNEKIVKLGLNKDAFL